MLKNLQKCPKTANIVLKSVCDGGAILERGRFKHIRQEVQCNLIFLKVEWTNPKFHMSILIISNRMLVSTFKCKN